MRQRVAVEDRAGLDRDLRAVDGSAPQNVAWLPVRMDLRPAAVGEHHRDAALPGVDLDFHAAPPHDDDALTLETQLLGLAQLSGNAALALVECVVDMRGRDRQPPFRFALGDQRMESLREFFDDEAGREMAFAPARML